MPVFQRFYPVKESAQIPWLINYKTKIPTHGPVCGLPAGEITTTLVDLTFLIWLLETWNPAVQQDAQEATAYKKLIAQGGVPGASPVAVPVATAFASPPPAVTPGVLPRLFNQIARLKISAGFLGNPEALGADLQIVGAEDTTEHPAPEFKLKVQQGAACQCVRLDFTKFSHEAVWIEGRRNGGAWEFVAVDSEKPYLDERPLLVAGAAETREYRLRFWDKGAANGEWTAVQKTTVGA